MGFAPEDYFEEIDKNLKDSLFDEKRARSLEESCVGQQSRWAHRFLLTKYHQLSPVFDVVLVLDTYNYIAQIPDDILWMQITMDAYIDEIKHLNNLPT